MTGGPWLLFLGGGAFLIAGAELLVRGAARLAAAAGVSSLVVGLTVVAFGTSAPELAVTVGSAWEGHPGMALGNVVGSNIFNVLFILGLSATIAPLVVAQRLVRLDVPVMIAASVLTLLLALDGRISRPDGVVLVAAVIAYTTYLVRTCRRGAAGESPGEDAHPAASRTGDAWPVNVVLAVLGLVMLVLGARWLVAAAVTTARSLGMSQLVIGLTILAAGTSLPEVATSVLASARGERDIAVGNVVGSNLFNLLGVLGLGGIAAPHGIPVPAGALTFDLPVMIAVAVAALPIVFTGYTIARWEGVVFLGFYAAYTVYLVLQATRHDALHAFGSAMAWFVLPVTALTLSVMTLRAVRRGRAEADAGGGVGQRAARHPSTTA